MVLAWVSVVSALLPPAPPPRGAAIGSASPHVPSAHVQSCVAARRQAPAWRASAGDLFEPTFESAALYQQAEAQMRQLHGGKCTDAAAKALDEEFWVELESRMAPAVGALASDPSSLWRFRHFLTKQRIIALPLTGRTRIEGVTRLSLGPLKDMDQDRRQVRALAYYPGLRHQPYHDMGDFAWLRTLQSRADVIRRELDVYLSREDNMWAGNNCQDFDKYGWTQISLNTFGEHHSTPEAHFPQTLALMKELQVPYGPRDLCIVRQAAKSGLPRHSDQRNYMLTAHIVLKGPAKDVPSASPQNVAPATAPSKATGTAKLNRKERRRKGQRAAPASLQTPTPTPAPAAPPHKLAQQYACSLWCDGEEREWDVTASPTVIDTTYWHQTWNNHEEDMYVLLIDFWHPDLRTEEIQALEAFMQLEGISLRDKQGLSMSSLSLSPRMMPG
eukprot:Tamp_15090.p1 GENE.Tamp_15090~~Tamp_15090.p1  ORF type:complete len:460 (+),score=100.20 Tamp_15090:49-1380(+)